MTHPKIAFTVYKDEEGGYYAISEYKGGFINTQAATFAELKDMLLDATNLALVDENRVATADDIELRVDLASFFKVYKEINAKQLAKRAGINNSLLAQYVSGKKQPSQKQVSRVLEGIRSLGREMASLDLYI